MSVTAGQVTFERDLERLRPALTGYCYRMLGSGFEAEDATQEAMVRAWRRVDALKEPGAMKSWVFQIATNVCLDQIESRKRRARPVDLAGPGTADTPVGAPLPETTWVLPIADSQVLDPDADPADRLRPGRAMSFRSSSGPGNHKPTIHLQEESK